MVELREDEFGVWGEGVAEGDGEISHELSRAGSADYGVHGWSIDVFGGGFVAIVVEGRGRYGDRVCGSELDISL